MKDNRGYSLVEILIVIAILAVASLIGIMGWGAVWSSNVSSCANDLKSAVGKTRITTMGKDEAILRIYKDASDDAYYKEETTYDLAGNVVVERPEKIGKSLLTLTYTMETPAGTNTFTIDGVNELRITFDRSSGAQREVTPGAGRCTEINVNFGSRNSRVVLVPATGKVYID